MEGTYACNLNNRFDLFLDEENDPLEILAKTQQDKRKPAEKSKDAKKDAKKKGLSKTLKESVKTIAAAVVETNAAPKPLSGRNNVGTTSPTQGNRPPRRDNNNGERRMNNSDRSFEPRPEGDRPPRDNRGPRDSNRPPRTYDGTRNNEGGNRPYRGDGGNRGGPREGQRAGGRGREFDRHSGDVRSGVKATEKRGGQGAHNWGTKSTELDTTPEQEAPEAADALKTEAGAAEAAEPVEVQITLEEWKKEMAAKASKTEYAATRKPNEGIKEDPKLKKVTVLKKKKADSDESDDGEGEGDGQDAEDECEKLKKELEKTLASQFQFPDSHRNTRGGRGGGRGAGRGGGRPGDRGPMGGPRRDDAPLMTSRPPQANKPPNNPSVFSKEEFPSLFS